MLPVAAAVTRVGAAVATAGGAAAVAVAAVAVATATSAVGMELESRLAGGLSEPALAVSKR